MIYAIITVLVLIADQAVKFWTTKNILLAAVGEDCVSLIPGFVRLTNVHNYGAAFSILQNARWPLVVVTVLFVIVIIALINREVIYTGFGRWTAVLVVAGAIGNCIDRALYGYVVDMFEFEFFNFPVFNVADIFITVCGILFCVHMLFYKESAEVRAANEPEFMRRAREEKEARRAEKLAAREQQWQDGPAESGFDPARKDPFAGLARHSQRIAEQEQASAGQEPAEDLWGFDGQADSAPARESFFAPPAEESDFQFGAPAQAPAAGGFEMPNDGFAPPAAPAPAADDGFAPAPQRDTMDDLFGDYSLDDILSEFGDY